MSELILWKNQEMNKLRRDMDRLFARVWEEFSMPLFPRPAREVPFIDVSETKENLIIKAELPGGNPEDLKRIPDTCEFPNEWPQNVGRTIRHVLGPLGNYDWKKEVSSLKVPTLVIQGEKDRIVPMEGSRIWAARPNARLLIIPGSGHFPFVEKPEVFFPAIDNFLNENKPE